MTDHDPLGPECDDHPAVDIDCIRWTMFALTLLLAAALALEVLK